MRTHRLGTRRQAAPDPARSFDLIRALATLSARRRTAVDLPLDLQLVGGSRRQVVQLLPSIAYGTTRSCAGLADAAGNPGAVRAAGTACARNPLPIVVPCHRVVRADGGIGQYLGGPDAKLALLRLEGAR